MMLLDPSSLPPDQAARLSTVSRMLGDGAARLLSSNGESVDLPPSVQELLRTMIRLMEAGQSVTLFPAVADPKTLERVRAVDELAREAYALGLYERNVPDGASPGS